MLLRVAQVGKKLGSGNYIKLPLERRAIGENMRKYTMNWGLFVLTGEEMDRDSTIIHYMQ